MWKAEPVRCSDVRMRLKERGQGVEAFAVELDQTKSRTSRRGSSKMVNPLWRKGVANGPDNFLRGPDKYL